MTVFLYERRGSAGGIESHLGVIETTRHRACFIILGIYISLFCLVMRGVLILVATSFFTFCGTESWYVLPVMLVLHH